MAHLPWQSILRAYVLGLGLPVFVGGLLQWAVPGEFPFLFLGALGAIPLALFLGIRAIWPALQGEEASSQAWNQQSREWGR